VSPTSPGAILVLDDDDGFRRFLVRVLREAAYSVLDTGDPNEAMRLIEGTTPLDLVIADVRMPLFQPHGIAVGKAAMSARRGIKVIYISGEWVPTEFIDVSQTPLLAKPIKRDTLLASVRAALASGK